MSVLVVSHRGRIPPSPLRLEHLADALAMIDEQALGAWDDFAQRPPVAAALEEVDVIEVQLLENNGRRQSPGGVKFMSRGLLHYCAYRRGTGFALRIRGISDQSWIDVET